MSIYTIAQREKIVGFLNDSKHYVIGFRSPKVTRKVMYSLHPNPTFKIVRDDFIDISTSLDLLEKVTVDPKATIFIPKFKGSSFDPMNDGCFHLSTVSENKFFMYPFTKRIGVILPYDLIEENNDEFIFKSQVIDPCFIASHVML